MKILFFCGSLEPGRDGVGDYTRALAGECAARGHDCTVIALQDPAVARVTDLTPGLVRLIRLPVTETWAERLLCAQQHLRRLAPDWVSWQLVAYAFHPRGFLPSALLEAAATLRGPRCHVMMHELWLGLEAGASWRDRGLGWLQRRGVLYLLDALQPDRVHTSNSAYQQALARAGCPAAVLPLFGNVPLAEPAAPAAPPPPAAPLVAATFGTIHPQWHPAATLEWLTATARRLGRPAALLVIGRVGAHASALLAPFGEAGVAVTATGEVDVRFVSRLLGAADFGIALHPWALVGKSGAVAAMLEHGLPVLVPRDDWQLRRAAGPVLPPSDPLLARLAELDAPGTDRWLASRRTPEPALPRLATAFLAALENASPSA